MNKSRDENIRSFTTTLERELEEKLNVYSNSRTTVANAAGQRLNERFRKKLASDSPDLALLAVRDFVVYNDLVATSTPCIDPDVLSDARHFIVTALERFTNRYSDSIQCSLDMGLIYSLWRFGPGSSNGVKGSHFAVKINQPMTSTASCAPFVRMLRRLTPRLRFYDETSGVPGVVLTEGSRLSTVPKNQETARVICFEPSGNMALQLAAGAYLEGALRCVGLDISNQQDKNNSLASEGSLTDLLATIDMKHASDLLSIPLIKLLFPPEWFEFLMKIRSPTATYGADTYQLNMMSTMGNGFTFPMMTLTFLALIYGFQSKFGGKSMYIDYSTVGVFGDDIILPSSQYDDFVSLLQDCALIVNTDKSFSRGPFRESCGGDYYLGENISPFYVRSLHNDASIYVAINQLMQWCTRHDIYLYKTLSSLLTMLRSGPFLVPFDNAPTSGIRYCKVYRRYTQLVPVQKYTDYSGDPSLELLCITGGYLSAGKERNRYLPRPIRNRPLKYVKIVSRLPKGYLDGRPICRDGYENARKSDFFLDVVRS